MVDSNACFHIWKQMKCFLRVEPKPQTWIIDLSSLQRHFYTHARAQEVEEGHIGWPYLSVSTWPPEFPGTPLAVMFLSLVSMSLIALYFCSLSGTVRAKCDSSTRDIFITFLAPQNTFQFRKSKDGSGGLCPQTPSFLPLPIRIREMLV